MSACPMCHPDDATLSSIPDKLYHYCFKGYILQLRGIFCTVFKVIWAVNKDLKWPQSKGIKFKKKMLLRLLRRMEVTDGKKSTYRRKDVKILQNFPFCFHHLQCIKIVPMITNSYQWR